MIKLTQHQEEAVCCTNKYCLVTGRAGSGKTLVLAERIKRLVANLSRGEKVLALTFTNKAARELKDRLLSMFSEDELAEKAFVGTIHSFCAEFVARRGSTIGLPSDLHVFESVEDRLAIFADAVDAVPQMRAKVSDERALRLLFDQVVRAKRSQAFSQQFLSRPENKMVFEEYRSRMLLQHAVDFDDILAFAAQILSEQPALARMYQRIYRHICIDEAQDLNDAQYQVVQALAGESCGIMMVGDSRQSIYGFNGSAISIMTERFSEDYPVVKFVLEENFRSSKAVMRYSQIIESSSQMIPQLAIEGEAGCYEFGNEREEACWVIDRIVSLEARGSKLAKMDAVPADGCAVLARNRYVLATLRDELGKRGIGYNERITSGDAASSESDLFNYFHTGLRLIASPNDALHLNMLNAKFSREEKFASFEDILAGHDLYDGLSLAASDALRSSWNCLVRGSALRFDLALDVLRRLCATKDAFSGDDDRLLAVSDCEQWTTWWEKYCLSTGPSSRSLNGFLRALSLGEVLDSQQDGEGLTLSTIHLAKGLEFDVVFIIGLNEGTFPDYRSRTSAQLDEERHSMFVAITRAKRICYVTRPKFRRMPWGDLRVQVPSCFFTELQSESR